MNPWAAFLLGLFLGTAAGIFVVGLLHMGAKKSPAVFTVDGASYPDENGHLP